MDNEIVSKLLESLSPEQQAELVQQLLQKQTTTKSETQSYKRNPPNKDKDESLFVMKQETSKVRKSPVTEGKRFNKFTDSGEHRDEANKTPPVKLTERRRPSFQLVEQTCTRCSKKVQVHPQHARDFYVCDSCLRR